MSCWGILISTDKRNRGTFLFARILSSSVLGILDVNFHNFLSVLSPKGKMGSGGEGGEKESFVPKFVIRIKLI